MAALQQVGSIFRNNFVRDVEKRASTPEEKVLTAFDVAHEWFCQKNFYGCIFTNVIGEYSKKDSPIRDVSKQHKSLMQGYFEEWLNAAGKSNAEQLAKQIGILLEGAIVVAQVTKDPKAALVAKDATQKLLQAG